MKTTLRKRILTLLIAFVILLDGVSIYMSYHNFVVSREQFSYSTASTVAETCSLVIDGDSLGKYIETGKRDSHYYETWNKLIDYRNTNTSIVKLSVVWFDEAGCHYIFDTDLSEKGAFLGDTKSYDEKQLGIKELLVRGEQVEFIGYYGRMDVYRPILSSYNIPMGYVVVGISAEEAEKEQYEYLLKMGLMVLLLSFIVTAFIIRKVSKRVIEPVNQLSDAMANYVDSVKDDREESTLSRLDIRTGDEIERLYYSLKKMESDLMKSTSSLNIALWNSYHDSMTRLYNKRYLKDYQSECTQAKTLAVIYCDVDNLKKMNDICGHEAGDEVIRKTADFLLRHQPEGGTCFRIGGDEFLMIICDMPKAGVEALIQEMYNNPIKEELSPNREVRCRIALGYSYAEEHVDLEVLIQKADKNMYRDKHNARNNAKNP